MNPREMFIQASGALQELALKVADLCANANLREEPSVSFTITANSRIVRTKARVSVELEVTAG